MEKINIVQPLFPHLPKRLAGLEALAENLWWSWNPGARMLFKTLDRQAWKESGHNPDKMLREFPRELLEKAGADADYIRRYDDVMAVFRNYMQQKKCDLLAPFSRNHKYAVAYFSAEYGLHRSLPFYAGGLGFLAGDYLKDFAAACEKNINTTIFTTHTPVAAGHDVFPFQLIEKYFHSYWPDLGLDRDAFFQLGIHPEKPGAGFNMTAFALRLSGYCNAVSKRHAEVSRKIWQSLWPDVPQNWVKAMKAAMKSNAARFFARRMVKEYIEKFYSKGMR